MKIHSGTYPGSQPWIVFKTHYSLLRVLRITSWAILILFFCATQCLLIKAEPFVQSILQSAEVNASEHQNNPTSPEIQPRLDVDSDPIPSPDSNDKPIMENTSPLVHASPGAIQKLPDGTYTMHEDADEVLLNCVVVDQKGRFVTDLHKRNFHIWEDGVLQTNRSFIHSDLPVSMGLLIDSSGSMRDKRSAIHFAALDFLKKSNPQDATFLVNFSDHAYLDQGFTSNINALDQGLAHGDSRGTTAMYDAVVAAADELSRHGRLTRQVLLVITDGADNASRLDLDQAIRRVQYLGGPVVYTIGLLFDTDTKEAQRAKDALERLSKETGGIAYFPHSLSDVDGIAAEIALDIREQYIIGYHSTHPAILGGYRKIRIEASASKHGKLIARTRNGYYARKPALPTLQAAQASHPVTQ